MKVYANFNDQEHWERSKIALVAGGLDIKGKVIDPVADAMRLSSSKVIWATNMPDPVYQIAINSDDQDKAIKILSKL